MMLKVMYKGQLLLELSELQGVTVWDHTVLPTAWHKWTQST